MHTQGKLLIKTWIEEDIKERREKDLKDGLKIAGGLCAVGILAVMVVLLMTGCVTASDKVIIKQEFIAGYSIDAWADAIRKAEGNENYGILSIPCTKGADCRRICKNSIRNGWNRYRLAKGLPKGYRGNSSDLNGFVEHFAKRYCPVGAGNDPEGLNRHWVKNVLYWIGRA